ncbi:MAG TPA: ATP-binding protein [Clostridia bacterium]|nr:ATP-binding protein [Clostridia bacterium]
MISNPEPTTDFNKKSSRRLTIGVIKSNMVEQRDILVVEGLKQAAVDNDVNLIVYCGGMIVSPNDFHKNAISIFDFVDKNRLDGLVIWTGNINWHASTEFTEMFVKKYNYLPVVSLEIKMDGITSIIWDDYKGMRDALIHLIEVHKYKRIGFVMGTSPMSLYRRYDAYIETLEEYGIPVDPKLIIDHDTLYNYENALQYAAYMDRSIFVEQGIIDNLDKSSRIIEAMWGEGIEALACCNDLNAKTVSKVLKAVNLPAIPMIGFDDDLESRACNPGLTTVRPPHYEVGKRAIEVIIAKINRLETPETESIPCSLIVRQSCGCACNSVIKEDLYKGRLKCIIPQDSGNINAEKFGRFVKSVVDIPDSMDAEWPEKLLKVFFEDIQEDNGAFADYLKSLFAYTPGKKYAEVFRDIIMVMHLLVDSLINNNCLDYYKAKMLLQQGTVLIADMRARTEINKRLKQTHRHFDIVTFSQIISNIYDINDVMGNIANGLRYLGVSSCYLSVYENGGVSTEKSRLLLAYNESGNISIPQDVCIYSSKQLVPEGVLQLEKQFNYILKPLYFKKRNIGFVMYSDTLEDSREYERINDAICNALHSAILVEELKIKAQELIKINSELESAYSLLKENQQKLLISEKMASLGRLTAGIAHEMNTPLALVRTTLKELGELIQEYKDSIGNTDVLPEDHRLIAEDMMKCLKLAAQAAEKSSGFIKGIKAQTTNINAPVFQVFNAADVIKDVLSILNFALKKGNCRLSTNIDKSIKLYGDPNKLVQVATNLVINSIDACKPDGGNISVILENNGDGFARLTFQDTGCGIPEEIKSQIFDPMFTTKPFGEGTGLGLSIVHDLVAEFNGSISLESQKGLTSFFISLPIKLDFVTI